LIKLEPDLDREPALRRLIRLGIGSDHLAESEMLNLSVIGIGDDAKAAGRRQPRSRQRRQIRRLRPDALGIVAAGSVRGRMNEDAINSCLYPSP